MPAKRASTKRSAKAKSPKRVPKTEKKSQRKVTKRVSKGKKKSSKVTKRASKGKKKSSKGRSRSSARRPPVEEETIPIQEETGWSSETSPSFECVNQECTVPLPLQETIQQPSALPTDAEKSEMVRSVSESIEVLSRVGSKEDLKRRMTQLFTSRSQMIRILMIVTGGQGGVDFVMNMNDETEEATVKTYSEIMDTVVEAVWPVVSHNIADVNKRNQKWRNYLGAASLIGFAGGFGSLASRGGWLASLSHLLPLWGAQAQQVTTEEPVVKAAGRYGKSRLAIAPPKSRLGIGPPVAIQPSSPAPGSCPAPAALYAPQRLAIGPPVPVPMYYPTYTPPLTHPAPSQPLYAASSRPLTHPTCPATSSPVTPNTVYYDGTNWDDFVAHIDKSNTQVPLHPTSPVTSDPGLFTRFMNNAQLYASAAGSWISSAVGGKYVAETALVIATAAMIGQLLLKDKKHIKELDKQFTLLEEREKEILEQRKDLMEIKEKSLNDLCNPGTTLTGAAYHGDDMLAVDNVKDLKKGDEIRVGDEPKHFSVKAVNHKDKMVEIDSPLQYDHMYPALVSRVEDTSPKSTGSLEHFRYLIIKKAGIRGWTLMKTKQLNLLHIFTPRGKERSKTGICRALMTY